MSGLFISYRRDDSSADAGRLFDDLKRRCPESQVFMDLGIRAGEKFREAIVTNLDLCIAVLVLIGPNWFSERAPRSGLARLEEEDDFVRFEVAMALQKNKLVIPILLRGAILPAAEDLPADIKALVSRQAIDIRPNHWGADVNELISQLPPTLGCGCQPMTSLAGNRWVYLALLPVFLIATCVQFSAVVVPVPPEVVAFGLAGGIGVLHVWLFRLPVSSRLLFATFISIVSVALMSALNWLIHGDALVSRSPADTRLIGMFVIAVLAGYLVGGLCVDALRWRTNATQP